MKRYAADLVFKVIEIPDGEEAPAVLDPRWKELRRHGLSFKDKVGDLEEVKVNMKWLITSAMLTAKYLTMEEVLKGDSQ